MQLQSNHVSSSALTAKRPGTTEPWFSSSNHEINAGSTAEVVAQLARLAEAVASGQVSLDSTQKPSHEVNAAVQAERQEALQAAYNNWTGAGNQREWSELGSLIGAEVSQTLFREGFMRRYMERAEITQGIVRVRIKYPAVTGVVAASPSQTWPQFFKARYFVPPEFYVKANVLIEERDILQGSSDLLDDAFQQCQEQIMVQEDLVYKASLDATVGIANAQQILVGGLTPTSLASMRASIAAWGLPPANLLMSSDGWANITGNAAVWGNAFDPVTKYELIQTGFLGTIFGMSILSDAYRVVEKQVLKQGEFYVLSSMDTHGVYTDRGPVKAQPIDGAVQGVPARGWFFWELLSITVANARSVVKGLAA